MGTQQQQQTVDVCNTKCILIQQAYNKVLEDYYLLGEECTTANPGEALLYYFVSEQNCDCKILNSEMQRFIRDNCSLIPNESTQLIPVTSNSIIQCNGALTLNLDSIIESIKLDTVFIISNPSLGTVSYSNPNLLYVADPNHSGEDDFIIGYYNDNDKVKELTVNVEITPCISPDAEDKAYTSFCGSSVQVELDNNYNILTQPLNGTLNSLLVYTPNPGFLGTDSFTYNISVPNSNPQLTSQTSTVVINTVESVSAVDDTYSVPYQSVTTLDVLNNDIGTTITHIAGVPVSNGDTISLNNGNLTLVNNQIVFDATGNRNIGLTETTYTITDNKGCTSTAILSINTNRPPSVYITGDYLTDNETYEMGISIEDGQGTALNQGEIELNVYVDNVLYSKTTWDIGDDLSSAPKTDVNSTYVNELQSYITGSVIDNSTWQFSKRDWAISKGYIGINLGKDVKFSIQATNSDSALSNISETTATTYRSLMYNYLGVGSTSSGTLETAVSINSSEPTQSVTSYSFTNSITGSHNTPIPAIGSSEVYTGTPDDNSCQYDLVEVTTSAPTTIPTLPNLSTKVRRHVWNEGVFARLVLIFGSSGNSNVLPYNIINSSNDLSIEATVAGGIQNADPESCITQSSYVDAYLEVETSPGSGTFNKTTYSASSPLVQTGQTFQRETLTFTSSQNEGVYKVNLYHERDDNGTPVIAFQENKVVIYSY